jgi:hypothetical protein
MVFLLRGWRRPWEPLVPDRAPPRFAEQLIQCLMEQLKFPEETSSGPRSIRPRIVVVIRHVGGGLQSHLNLFLEGSKTTGREGRPDRSGLSRNIAVSDPRVRRILLPVVAFAIAAGALPCRST